MKTEKLKLFGQALAGHDFQLAEDFTSSELNLDDYYQLLFDMLEKRNTRAFVILLGYGPYTSNYWNALIWSEAMWLRNIKAIESLMDKKFNVGNLSETLVAKYSEDDIIDMLNFLAKHSIILSDTDRLELLFEASERGYVNLIKFLRKNGLNINLVYNSRTALEVAKNLETFNILSNLGARTYLQTLEVMIRRGNVEIVRRIFEYWGSKAKKYGLMSKAINSGSSEMVQLLLDNGGEIEEWYYSESSLDEAIRLGFKDIAKILLKHGATFKLSTFRNALLNGQTATVNFMLELGYKISVCDLIGLLEKGSTSVNSVKFLIDHGAKVDDSNALSPALQYSSTEIVKYLVEMGAKIKEEHIKDALMSGSREKLEYILSFGVKINTEQTSSLVNYIQYDKYDELLPFLIDAGLDVNLVDENDRTILMNACRGGNIESVRLLIDKGADVNALSKYGWSALMFACKHGKPETIRILVDAGADVNASNGAASVSMLAKKYQGGETIDFLKDAWAK